MRTFRVFALSAVTLGLLGGAALARHGTDDVVPEVVQDIPDIQVPEIPSIDHSGPGGGDLPSTIENIPDIEVPEVPSVDSGSDVADRAISATDRDDHSGHDNSDHADAISDHLQEDKFSHDASSSHTDRIDRQSESYASTVATRGGDDHGGGRHAGKNGALDSGDHSGKGSSGSDSSEDGSSGSGSSGSGSSGSNSSGSDSSGSDSSGSGSSGSNSGSSSSVDNSGSGSQSSGSGSGGSESSGGSNTEEADIQYSRSGGPVSYETDRDGQDRRSGELILLSSPEELSRAKESGFDIITDKKLTALDGALARIRVRDGESLEGTMAALQKLAPSASVSANYGYRLASGVSATSRVASPPVVKAVASSSVVATRARIGVIDTGAETFDKRLQLGRVRAFASNSYTPRPHGTAVATIASADGLRIDVADVFDIDSRGAVIASADSIARAIDWLVSQGAPVINISIEGPASPVLQAVIKQAVDAGVIIVAAAGNGGAAAPPVYPAAYENVIGVTAVDKDSRIYRRANRGEYIDFAALGVKVPVQLSDKEVTVTGTSYAAPWVAAVAARWHTDLAKKSADKTYLKLKNAAVDQGPVGRDPIYGWGVLAKR